MYHIKQTHNLEVLGSSPRWPTDKHLINRSLWGIFFIVPSLLIIEIGAQRKNSRVS